MRKIIIEKALVLSGKRCTCSNYLHFCVAFRGKNIIASGFNCFCRKVTHLGHTLSMHAEISALQRVKNPQKTFDLFVFRNSKDGENFMDSQPCIRCENWMKNYKIGKVYYTTSSGIKSISSRPLATTFKNHPTYRKHDCKDHSGLARH